MLNCIEPGKSADVIVLARFRPVPARPAWVRRGAHAAFLLGRRECDGVIEGLNDAAGTAHIRITSPAIMKGNATIQRYNNLVDPTCPPDEDRHGDHEGGAA